MSAEWRYDTVAKVENRTPNSRKLIPSRLLPSLGDTKVGGRFWVQLDCLTKRIGGPTSRHLTRPTYRDIGSWTGTRIDDDGGDKTTGAKADVRTAQIKARRGHRLCIPARNRVGTADPSKDLGIRATAGSALPRRVLQRWRALQVRTRPYSCDQAGSPPSRER